MNKSFIIGLVKNNERWRSNGNEKKNIIGMGMCNNPIPISVRVGEECTPHILFHKHGQQYES